MEEQLISWRRHFHQFPELSFKEFRTAAFVAQALSDMEGIKVEKGVGLITGVVGQLKVGKGPTVALRADMDALPIYEENETEYRSTHHGVMHACGHDAHTAILLATAKILSNLAKEGHMQGTVRFIFQPAEETPDQKGFSGSPYLLEAGAYEGVDVAFALHMCPWLKSGDIQIHDGYSMANVDEFKATIIGSGGHGGYPEKATDPTWMLGLLLQSLHGIVSRRISALDQAVVSIGEIKAGTATNIIPSEVYISGTIRSYQPDVREALEEEIKRAFSVIEPLGGKYNLSFHRGEPALYNHHHCNLIIKSAAQKLKSGIKVTEAPFGLGGEDFGYVTKQLPGAMFFLGCSLLGELQRELHTPVFDIDESALVLGTAIFVQIAAECGVIKYVGV